MVAVGTAGLWREQTEALSGSQVLVPSSSVVDEEIPLQPVWERQSLDFVIHWPRFQALPDEHPAEVFQCLWRALQLLQRAEQSLDLLPMEPTAAGVDLKISGQLDGL